MRRIVCFLFLLTPLLRGEVIDRIVAVVEGRIITTSDLRQEREIRAIMGEKPITEDQALTRELVDKCLIERQIADYPNVDVSDDEVDSDLQKSVTPGGAASPALRDAIRLRIRMQKFFELRFRGSIRPTEDQIRKYYEDVFVPAARARGLSSIPPLSDPEMAAAVRDNVIQESLDREIDVWLEAVRRRSTIEVF